MKKNIYEIVYNPGVKDNLKYIDKKYWNLIKTKIIEQLEIKPNKETKNRKPLSKPPMDNRWELRFGPQNRIRVFYSIQYDKKEVWILAIGEKVKGKLLINGKEIGL